MTSSQQQRKDLQDEARRKQQADERIHKLEQEVERLREALKYIAFRGEKPPIDVIDPPHHTWEDAVVQLRELAQEALEGGGDNND